MLSDITYALLTMTAMGLSPAFWNVMSPGYSLLRTGADFFGWFVFRSNPLKGWNPQLPPVRIACSGFHLLLPAYFLQRSHYPGFMGLYTRFSFNPVAGDHVTRCRISAFILAAFSWWFFLRSSLPVCASGSTERLILLNRTVGSLFMVIGAGGILPHSFPNCSNPVCRFQSLPDRGYPHPAGSGAAFAPGGSHTCSPNGSCGGNQFLVVEHLQDMRMTAMKSLGAGLSWARMEDRSVL